MITREALLAKRAEIKDAYEMAVAQMNAFGGALQFCEHLLEELDQAEKVVQEVQLKDKPHDKEN